MRRGFKSEANAIAREVWAELSLYRTSSLDVWRLAEHLDIPVIPLSSFHRTAPEAARLFLNGGQAMFQCSPGLPCSEARDVRSSSTMHMPRGAKPTTLDMSSRTDCYSTLPAQQSMGEAAACGIERQRKRRTGWAALYLYQKRPRFTSSDMGGRRVRRQQDMGSLQR